MFICLSNAFHIQGLILACLGLTINKHVYVLSVNVLRNILFDKENTGQRNGVNSLLSINVSKRMFCQDERYFFLVAGFV